MLLLFSGTSPLPLMASVFLIQYGYVVLFLQDVFFCLRRLAFVSSRALLLFISVAFVCCVSCGVYSFFLFNIVLSYLSSVFCYLMVSILPSVACLFYLLSILEASYLFLVCPVRSIITTQSASPHDFPLLSPPLSLSRKWISRFQ